MADNFNLEHTISEVGASTPQPATSEQVTGPSAPTHEQIAQRAYERFLMRGGEPGGHEDDWYQAEQELRGTEG